MYVFFALKTFHIDTGLKVVLVELLFGGDPPNVYHAAGSSCKFK